MSYFVLSIQLTPNNVELGAFYSNLLSLKYVHSSHAAKVIYKVK